MGKKQKWWDRLEFVTRNITASMDATDADLRDLADRVAALERSISSDPVDQSAELHERIAGVLITVAEGRAVYELTTADAAVMADALIRELGLHKEFSVGDDEGGRTLWFADEEPVTPREGEVVEHRWISQWERDE